MAAAPRPDLLDRLAIQTTGRDRTQLLRRLRLGNHGLHDALEDELRAVALVHAHRLDIDEVVSLLLALRLEQERAVVALVCRGQFLGERHHRAVDPAVQHVAKLQHVTEVERPKSALHFLDERPGLEQIVGAGLPRFADRKRAQGLQPLDLVAGAAVRGGFREPRVERELFLVAAQADQATNRGVGRRSCRGATSLRAQTGHRDADHGIERAVRIRIAAARRRVGTTVRPLQTRHRNAARQAVHYRLKLLGRERREHPLARLDRAEADLNRVPGRLGRVLQRDEECGDALVHRPLLAIAGPVDPGIQRRRPAETRTRVLREERKRLHLRAAREQVLHRLGVEPARFRLVDAHREPGDL